jgi:hypothetical protein
MQLTIFWTLASIGWITCVISVPDSVILASVAKNNDQVRGVSGLTTALAASSGFLTTGYYDDKSCQTLKYADGVKLGACEYLSTSNKYRITSVDQSMINVVYYDDKDCSIVHYSAGSIAFTDGVCTAAHTAYRVSATRDMSIPGFMKRSVSKICSYAML